uniref:tRNA-intron lyase n=1 Tax=Acrobeloides nanus TaxID=290746 RepID=A0A914EHB3_9BILA
MNELYIEYKAGINQDVPPPIKIPIGKYEAVLQGGDFVVKNSRQAQQLYAYGSFGTFIGQRMNFVNARCISRRPLKNGDLENKCQEKAGPSNEDSCEDVKESLPSDKNWLALISNNCTSFLGPEETLYLEHELGVLSVINSATGAKFTSEDLWKRFLHNSGLHFVKRYAVYRYFRQNGWILRSGLSFGVDYLLYKDGPEYTHSSAGIRICDELKDPCTAAMMRELRNCKKALIVISLKIPVCMDTSTIKCLDLIPVEPLILNRWMPNRSRIEDLKTKVEGLDTKEEFEMDVDD